MRWPQALADRSGGCSWPLRSRPRWTRNGCARPYAQCPGKMAIGIETDRGLSLLIRLPKQQRPDALHIELATELVIRGPAGSAPLDGELPGQVEHRRCLSIPSGSMLPELLLLAISNVNDARRAAAGTLSVKVG